MAWQAESRERADGDAAGRLAMFRRDLFGCFLLRADALFELGDALLTAGRLPSLPYLSEELAFRRSHGMIYQGLAQGRIDEDALRDLLAGCRPADWPCVFGIDASTIGRPTAVTSPGREFHHHSCAGHTGSGDPVIKGWAWQWLSQLSFDADSWTAPQDAIRIGRDDAAAVTARQILAHAARLRRAGEARIPLYVMDAGYDEAPVTWELRDHLQQVQILVRVRNDRVMYRDPAPEPRRPGRPRRHGQDRFACADPGTWGEPDQVIIRDDPRYGLMTVMSWGGLHPKLACRGHFQGMARPPVIRCHLIRVAVEHLPGGRAVPGPLWLWWAGPGQPDLDLCARGYLHRFDLEHAYRFAKDGPGLAQGSPADPGPVRPLDLDHHQRDHPAAPGPRPGPGPSPRLGTPPPPGPAYSRPRAPGFRPPDPHGRHASQPAETLKSRARPPQRPDQHPSPALRRDQESRLTRAPGLKRKLRA